MFSYVMVSSRDLEKSKAFYDATLGVLGYDEGIIAPDDSECVYVAKHASFVVYKSADEKPVSRPKADQIAFKTRESSLVDAWHAAGVANGGTTCDDPPGIRDNGVNRVYNAYLRDPDGNKLCAIVWMKMSGR